MPNPKLRLDENVEGEFFVNSTCINCDTCRQLAPAVFEEDNGYSIVIKQPESKLEGQKAMRAALSCPTGSIGHDEQRDRRAIQADFPLKLDVGLYYNGFTSSKSFGGSSYFVQYNDENWLIDSPRYTPHLVEQFEDIGGLDYIFLTHRDDVADADKYANKLDAERIIHYGDRSAQRNAEHIIEGYDPIEFTPGFVIIPTPGHTKGHCVLLVGEKYLFTGDHLYWKRDWDGLRATRRMCWYDWDRQVESMRSLLDYTFEWVLPGHGQRKKLSADQMHQKLTELVEKMEKEDYW